MNENELRELQERAHRIRQLQSGPDWELLKDYCSTVINAKNRGLLNGNAKTIEDYRADAGWISGAMFVLNAADHLDQQLETQMEIRQELKLVEEGG
jgi:hypothetical protein